MNRLTHLLAGAYAAACLVLLGQAVYANRRGDTAAEITLSCCAILFGCAIAHHTWHADELRAAQVRLELRSRPPDQRPAVDGVVAVALAAACCERWWTSAGTDHDPENCTRKDQTT